MPKKSVKDQPEMSLEGIPYEQAFSELEMIVSALESDSKSLDEALALFERGQALASYCAVLLDQAEMKVRQISGDTLTDLDPMP